MDAATSAISTNVMWMSARTRPRCEGPRIGTTGSSLEVVRPGPRNTENIMMSTMYCRINSSPPKRHKWKRGLCCPIVPSTFSRRHALGVYWETKHVLISYIAFVSKSFGNLKSSYEPCKSCTRLDSQKSVLSIRFSFFQFGRRLPGLAPEIYL